MRKIQYLFATIVLGLGLTSCGDSFLTQYPEGATLLEEQFKNLPDRLQGSIMGIYSKLYEYGDHSTFGQRSIDMYTDIQSGDMAMKKNSYGWFDSYERGLFYAYSRSYLWSYYYDIINLANLCENAVEKDGQAILEGLTTHDVTDEIASNGYYYGQILAMRGWAYANLLNYYCDPRDKDLADMDDYAVPVYTGTEVKAGTLGQPLSTVGQVYNRVYEDLALAIELLDYYGTLVQRGSKLEVDADVARLFLAYAMLNHGDRTYIVADSKNCYQIALDMAKEVIDGGKYPMMTQAALTATGFSDLQATNWMWAENVTVENTTALGSFFGQVDIHTYSYAAAGDTKAIDINLYNEIVATEWDARVNWFRDATGESKIGNGATKSGFAYCPDGKFYNPKTRTITDLDKVDREWLCDNLFMRVELAYLIAAEAAWSLDDYATAQNYLDQLCSERILDGKTTEYDNWLATLTTQDALLDAIVYNWRVEMWGEGYSMQMLRRLQKSRTLGSNHLTRGGQTLDVTGSAAETFQCEIPSSEVRYNPNLIKTELIKIN